MEHQIDFSDPGASGVIDDLRTILSLIRQIKAEGGGIGIGGGVGGNLGFGSGGGTTAGTTGWLGGIATTGAMMGARRLGTPITVRETAARYARGGTMDNWLQTHTATGQYAQALRDKSWTAANMSELAGERLAMKPSLAMTGFLQNVGAAGAGRLRPGQLKRVSKMVLNKVGLGKLGKLFKGMGPIAVLAGLFEIGKAGYENVPPVFGGTSPYDKEQHNIRVALRHMSEAQRGELRGLDDRIRKEVESSDPNLAFEDVKWWKSITGDEAGDKRRARIADVTEQILLRSRYLKGHEYMAVRLGEEAFGKADPQKYIAQTISRLSTGRTYHSPYHKEFTTRAKAGG